MKDSQILQTGAPASASLQRGPNPPHRILVAEDDEDIRRLNSDVLIGSGYHVDAVQDGAVAWAKLQLHGYDLLITDNEMPIVTGVDLLKKLRAARMALPVIVAAGTLIEEEFRRYGSLHPNAVLRKPYTIDELLITVQQVLSAKIATREKVTPTPKIPVQPPTDGWRL